MALALESIVKQLEDSGIVAGGKLVDFIPPKAHPKNVDELVRELVKNNHLTKFQAQQVAAGKVKALILGNYTILDKIGAGGMGQVFKAEHRRLERIVAIKMLPPLVSKDAVALARFQREVKAAAKLRHPNIVATDDADEANGVHFLVMEHIEGKDLSATVKNSGALPVNKAVNYILQAARGLEFAHSKGVIHRDIKPANLLLSSDGAIKLLDMGLARIESDGPVQTELTGTGTIMGTVDYMSPEQALNTKNADARADIYSLGISLYYLLSGKAAYSGDTAMEKLMAHQNQPVPSLQEVQAAVPKQLDEIFKQMVAKRAADRYQSMTEVIEALQSLGLAGSTSGSNHEVASALSLSAAERKKLGKQLTGKSVLTKVVTSEKSHAFLAKVIGGTFVTIVAPILVTFLIKYLEKSDAPPAATVASVATTQSTVPVPAVGGQPQMASRTTTVGKSTVSPPGSIGAPIDLIAQFDPARDDPNKTWKKEGTSLVGKELLKLRMPQPPPEEYDLDMEIDLSNRHPKGLALSFMTGGQQPTLVMDYDGAWVICDVDGLNNVKPNNPTRVVGLPWPVGERVSVRLSVRRDGLRVLLADKTIIDWRGKASQLSAASYFTQKAPGETFFNCGSPYTIHRLTLTPPAPSGLPGDAPQDTPVKSATQPAAPVSLDAALKFNGESYVDIPTMPFNANTPFTWEAFVSQPQVKSGAKFGVVLGVGSKGRSYSDFDKGSEPGQTLSIMRSSDQWRWKFGNEGEKDGAAIVGESSRPQRTHLACVHEGQTYRLFVDGKLSKSTDYGDPHKSDGMFQIGPRLVGVIDEVRISNVARYKENFTPHTRFETDADTLGLYHFDEGAGNELKDSSGKNHHGKITGAAWIKADGTPLPPR